MAFNTGNPVPSTDARDLSDNAENLDSAVNSQADTWVDRLGVTRFTVAGAYNTINSETVGVVAAADAAQITIATETADVITAADAFDVLALQRVNEIGVIYDSPLRPWSPSLLVNDLRAHTEGGETYIPKAALPFTTGATFDINNWSLLQGLTNGDIANDLSIKKIHPNVLAFKSDLTEYPDGKIIHLLDRGADFTKISGQSGDGFGTIPSTNVSQSIVVSSEYAGSGKAYGIEGDLITDDTSAAQAALDSLAPVIELPKLRITSQLLINYGQTVILNDDVFVDITTALGITATFADVMQASAFANKRGLATTLAFIGTGTIITAITNSGNFLPNENHNATDNGEIGIKISQRGGKIYSNRALYTPDTAPYAAVVLCITERCEIDISNIENMGAGVFSYHTLNGTYNLQGKNIGTDFRAGVHTTDLLAGSFGCLYLGKALNFGNEINTNGENCNDVMTFDGICRSNHGVTISREDETNTNARNNRVFELSDNCRGNTFSVTADQGGRFEHLVMQDNCTENIIELASARSQSRGVNLRRTCNNNVITGTVRDWDRLNLSNGAIELFQSSMNDGCDSNNIDMTLNHGTAGKFGIVEIINDAGKTHLKNDYSIKNVGQAVNFTFSNSNNQLLEGSVLEPSAKLDNTLIGESADLVASVGQSIPLAGVTALSAIRLNHNAQIRDIRVYTQNAITAGTVLIEVQVFRAAVWTTVASFSLTSSDFDVSRAYRDRFSMFVDSNSGSNPESLRVRAIPDGAYTAAAGTRALFMLGTSKTII